MAQATSDDSDLYGGIPKLRDFREKHFGILPQLIIGVMGLVVPPAVVQVECRELTTLILAAPIQPTNGSRMSVGGLVGTTYGYGILRGTGEYQLKGRILRHEMMDWSGTDQTIFRIGQLLPWLLMAIGGSAGWAFGRQLQRWEASSTCEMD